MAIRFHLDEHISPVVAEILRANGIDVTTSQEIGLLGHPDESQLSFAIGQGRTLVTCDADFTHKNTVSQTSFGICFAIEPSTRFKNLATPYGSSQNV